MSEAAAADDARDDPRDKAEDLKHAPEFSDPGDVAPGDEGSAPGGIRSALVGYGLGLAFAGALTVGSFVAPSTGLVYPPALPVALVVLAIAQMGVHLVFFLHVTTGPDNTNNVLALAFGVLIVFLVMTGSLWIMANLNHNMPGMNAVIKMQR